ncbi:MAG: hypothetical protein IMF19_15505 [Proteobacteria bacterium]|nr:hypothetical protein [Pseudomonadota bacterium]
MRRRSTKWETYHRGKVALYYAQLHQRFNAAALLKHLPQLGKIVWSREGLELVKKHLNKRNKDDKA